MSILSACPSIIKNPNLWRPMHFINGHFIDKLNNNNKFDVRNPANGQVIASLSSANAVDIDEASQIAMTTFHKWKLTTAYERSKILRKMSELMELYRDDLAAIVTLEAGKPWAEAKGELIYAQSFYEYYSEEAKRVNGDVIQTPMKSKRFLTIKQPVGPVGLITPWNFPAAMITRKVGPALAAGCTVVLKPSEETPLTALALCQIADEAGLPPGVLNCLPVSREGVIEAGRAMCINRNFRKISFTGSTAVGRVLMRDSASNIKRVYTTHTLLYIYVYIHYTHYNNMHAYILLQLSLELGGNAPFIVCEDAVSTSTVYIYILRNL